MGKKPLTNLSGAAILFLALVIFTLAINFGGMEGTSVTNWISYLIVIVGIMILVIKYGSDMSNKVSFGNLFAYGFKTVAILIIFYMIFTILFYMIFPKFKIELQDLARENALKNATPDMKEQAEKSIEIFNRFFWPILIGGILFSFAILGLIGSLLGAAIAKKEVDQNPGSNN
jgi:Na+(H+)/acetate symporter ActP